MPLQVFKLLYKSLIYVSVYCVLTQLSFLVVSAMKAKATRKKGRGVSDTVDEGPTGGALRC